MVLQCSEGVRLFCDIDHSRRGGRRLIATLFFATSLSVACGGASRTDDASGGSDSGGGPPSGATANVGDATGGAGATSASGGVSESGGAGNGGAGNGGGVSNSGGAAGGGSTDPSCPTVPPSDGESCGDDQACFYDDCPGEGLTRAGCFDSAWHVRTTPCCPDTVPNDGDDCPELEDFYYCVYDDCPGGNVSQAYCAGGTWGVDSRQCCPNEPPGSTAVTCGPDVTEWAGTASQYSCAWQDCTEYGVADGSCDSYGALTSVARSCEPEFFCGNGNTDQDYYCGSGQVCINSSIPGITTPGGAHIFRCADNPCAPGVLELDCLRESVCPTAYGAYLPYGDGMYVSCLL